MTEADGKKYYADYDSLLKSNHFKGEISTLTAKYKGDFSYEVLTNDQDEETSKLLKLPKLHMNDYFAEINFILSNPEIEETRSIEVFDLVLKKKFFGGRLDPSTKRKRFRRELRMYYSRSQWR